MIVPEGALTTEEEVLALLEEARQAGAGETEFTCSSALYDALAADEFSLLQLLLLKSGMDGNIWYSSPAYRVSLHGITYSDVPWAECLSETAVKEAVMQFGAQQAEAFTLICPEELAASLQESGKLYNFGGQGGYQRLRCAVRKNRIEVSECVPFDEPWAVVEDAAQFAAAVERFAAEKRESFYIVREQKYLEQLQEDELGAKLMLAASMLESYSSTAGRGGIYHYSGVEYTGDPKVVCYTEEDVVSAIRQMGALGASAFRLYLVGDLIEPLSEDSFLRLHDLEAEAGMSTARMAYSFSTTLRELQYSEAKIVADAVALDSLAGAIACVEDKVRSGETELTLFCSEALYGDLIGSLDNRFTIGRDGMTRIYDLISQAGIYDYELTSSRASHAITVGIKSLYPGTEITLALENGTEKALGARLGQTLAAARDMADACAAASPLDTARNIHDALCDGVVYETREGTTENDTAVGALLNGLADCDGYSDAFRLVGTLAGLNVRMQHGNGINTGFYGFLDAATHMWNLVELDGTWRMVDVTWDDAGDGIRYSWFNLGLDRAARSHRWNEDMTVPLLAGTDLSVRPENEFSVTSAAETEEAVKTALAQGYPVFFLIFDAEGYEGRQDAMDQMRAQYGEPYRYSWNEEMRMLEIEL